MSVKLPLGIEEIQEILPHRYPFLLVDKVTNYQDGVGVEGLKLVSANEPFFEGHFPGRPIMPGVLILEALAQLGVIYAKLNTPAETKDKLLVFAGIDKGKFRKQVVPGDVLELKAKIIKAKSGYWKLDGSATVDGEIAATAELTAAAVGS